MAILYNNTYKNVFDKYGFRKSIKLNLFQYTEVINRYHKRCLLVFAFLMQSIKLKKTLLEIGKKIDMSFGALPENNEISYLATLSWNLNFATDGVLDKLLLREELKCERTERELLQRGNLHKHHQRHSFKIYLAWKRSSWIFHQRKEALSQFVYAQATHVHHQASENHLMKRKLHQSAVLPKYARAARQKFNYRTASSLSLTIVVNISTSAIIVPQVKHYFWAYNLIISYLLCLEDELLVSAQVCIEDQRGYNRAVDAVRRKFDHRSNIGLDLKAHAIAESRKIF